MPSRYLLFEPQLIRASLTVAPLIEQYMIMNSI
jgi:hypothetical protein